MALQILLNLILAVVWVALQNSWTVPDFVVGYIVGLLFLFLLRRFLPSQLYIYKIVAIVKLMILFVKEMTLANLDVMKHVVSPKLTMQPGIVAIPLDVKTDFEITALANLITLTPGTLSMDISEDRRTLYIHCLHIEDVDELIIQIKGTFEKLIMEVTR